MLRPMTIKMIMIMVRRLTPMKLLTIKMQSKDRSGMNPVGKQEWVAHAESAEIDQKLAMATIDRVD